MAGDGTGGIYGEALFEAADEAGRIRPVQADLTAFGTALAESPDLSRVLFNPAFPEPGKRQILASLTAAADELVQNAMQVLVDHGRLQALPEVINAFDERFQRAARRLEVQLTTAIDIDDTQADKLRDTIARATGLEVELHREVDKAIIGGVVLRVRDLLIDASVRGRLEALRLSLRSARLAAGTASTGGEG